MLQASRRKSSLKQAAFIVWLPGAAATGLRPSPAPGRENSKPDELMLASPVAGEQAIPVQIVPK